MRFLKYLILLLLSLNTVSAGIALAQAGTTTRPQSSPCNVPVSGGILNEPNIFSEQQEEWLGEILAAQIEKAFKIVPDPEDYLQKLGDRLLAQLPKSNIHYRFTIIDLPESNAFGIPGGHIYLARRIIALARNEDELAGILGHEIGHIITRQPAIDLTREFQNILGVQQLGDRKDVLSKWNQLLDTWATKQETMHSGKRGDEEQMIADRIAIYAMARTGYQASRYVEFFDRLAQTKGNKGSFWTDLFGRTSHDAKRLRELLRTTGPAMQACLVESAEAGKGEQFFKWQKAVIASAFAVGKEAIPGLIAKQVLNPPLRSDLRTLHFSPDGKYLLAQDETSIFVLSANPVTNLFRVDAPDTYPAQFTPDSHAIVFYDKELRVQKWDIEGKRVWVRELALATHCLQTALSHSGEVLACLDERLQPQLVDVNNSTVLYNAGKLKEAGREGWIALLDAIAVDGTAELLTMRFSPDDHYFMAGRGRTSFAYDLKTKNVMALGKNVKELALSSFSFVSPDEIAGVMFRDRSPGIVRARFPSGDILDSIPGMFGGVLVAPDKGNYLLILQGREPAVKVFDWSTKKTALLYKKAGFALYGDLFAGETAGGEVGLYSMTDKSYQGGADLPNGPLSFTTTSLFSSDGNWLAVSQRTRGAVWNLITGERAFLTRGFEGALFDEDQLLAKFPKQGKETAAVFKLDTKTKTMQNLYVLPSEAPSFLGSSPSAANGVLYWQQTNVLLKATPLPGQGNQRPYLIEVIDVRTNKKLWEHKTQNGLPYAFHSRAGHSLTVVIGDYEDMKAEAREDAALNAKLNALVDEKRRAASYILIALDEATGKQLGKLLVDTGNLSFKIMSAVTIGDSVVVHDSGQRTRIYSLKSGEQKGTIFGLGRAVSRDGTKLLIEDGNGKADLYDLLTLAPLTHYEFPHPVVNAEFLNDAGTLLILTNDQTIYRLKLEAPPKSAAVEQP
jgi:WD40 repeat protein